MITTSNILNIALIGGLVIGGKKLFEKFGILQTAEEKKAAEASNNLDIGSTTSASKVNTSNATLALNPSYYLAIFKQINFDRTKKGLPVLSNEQIIQILKPDPASAKPFQDQLGRIKAAIYDSRGLFKDDVEKLYGQFQKLRNQAQISYLAKLFVTQGSQKDMFSLIKSFTNDTEREKLYNIIKSKPLI